MNEVSEQKSMSWQERKARNEVKKLRSAIEDVASEYEVLLGKYPQCDKDTRDYILLYMDLLGMEIQKYPFGFHLGMAFPSLIRSLVDTMDDSIGDHPMETTALTRREGSILGIW